MSDVLRFQRLPALAQDEVLKFMNLFEKFTLSTLSTKTRNIVKRYLGNQNSFRLDVAFYGDYLSLEFRDKESNEQRLYLKIRNLEDAHLVPPTSDWKILKENFPIAKDAPEFNVIAYFENRLDGVKRLIKYMADVYKNVIVSLVSWGPTNCFAIDIVKQVKDLNLKIKAVNVFSEELSDKLHKEVLDECREVEDLCIDCEISHNFEYVSVTDQPFQLDTLRIMQSNWVNIWHLNNLFINCKKLNLDNCNIDSVQMSAFLRRWIEGSKMKNLDIRTYKGSLDAMMNDEFPATEVRKAMIFFESPEKFPPGGCFLIRQNNGVEALIYKIKESFILTTEFKIEENYNDDDEDSDVSGEDEEEFEDEEDEEEHDFDENERSDEDSDDFDDVEEEFENEDDAEESDLNENDEIEL